jgi:hypothetical protein
MVLLAVLINKKSRRVQGRDFLIWRENWEDALSFDELNISDWFKVRCAKMHTSD